MSEHVHRERDRGVRIVEVGTGVIDTTASVPPPDQSYLLAAQIARRNHEQWFARAAQPWMYAVDELPIPGLIAGE